MRTTPRVSTLLLLPLALTAVACPGSNELGINTTALPSATVGEPYEATISAAGGAEDAYVWKVTGGTLPPGLAVAAEGTPATTVSGTPTEAGTFDFDVTVTDADGADATKRIRLIVEGGVGPKDLAVVTASLPSGVAGMTYSATIEASGGSEAGYTWAVTEGALPAGLTLGDAGTPSTTLSGTPSAEGSSTFTVTVTDSEGNTASGQLTLRIDPAGMPLSIVTQTLPDAALDTAYSVEITAERGSGTGYTWALSAGALPIGLMLEGEGTPSTTLFGTPTETGTFDFTVRVTDSTGAAATQALQLRVDTAPLTIQDPALGPGVVGVLYEAVLTAEGGTGSDYTWSVSQGTLPDGITLVAQGTPSTTLSGTSTEAGTFDFQVTVTDSDGNTGTRDLTLEIVEPIAITTATLPGGREGGVYFGPITASGGAGTGYQWSVIQGALPAGLSLSAMGTPTATVSGSPTEWGTFDFRVRVTEPLGTSAEADLTIALLPMPVMISTATVPQGTALSPYAAVITTVNGSLMGYTWTATGALPPGLTLDPTGTPPFTSIAGTPPVPGTWTATITVTDGAAGDSDSRRFTFEILPPPITIDTTALPAPTYGTPYSASLTASGGSGAGFAWSVVSGTLPPGLSLDPAGTPSTVLSGFPTAAGSFTFTVQVQDSFGTAASQQYSVDVSRDLVIGTRRLPDVTAGKSYSAPLVAAGGTGLGYTWTVTQGALPTGLVLGAGGTPDTILAGTTNATGLHQFTVQVTDSAGNTASAVYRLNVRAPQTSALLVGDLLLSNDTEVYLAPLGGGALTRLNTPAPGAGDVGTAFDDVQFSPDQTKMAFIGDFDVDNQDSLYVVDLVPQVGPPVEVSGTIVANGDVTDFAWSPDSSQLVFRADALTDNDFELFWVDLRGGAPAAPVRLNGPLVAAGDVSTSLFWSPDASMVAYLADENTDQQNELFLVDLRGASPSPARRVNNPMIAAGDVDDDVFFLPDASAIFYRADEVSDFDDGLYMAPIAGGAPQTPVQLNVADVDADDYALSPDGSRLFFISNDGPSGSDELFVVDFTTPVRSPPIKVNPDFMSGAIDVITAQWSPDGARIAYAADQDVEGMVELYVVDVSGFAFGTPAKVSPFAPQASADVDTNTTTGYGWSPDGTKIAVVMDAANDNVDELFVTDVSGAPPYTALQVNLPLPLFADVSRFSFSPDARYLAYLADAAVNAQTELFVSDVSAAPTSPMQVNATMPSGGDVVSSTDLAWSRASDAIYYRSDEAVDNDFEAWRVTITNGTPGTPAALNPPVPAGGDVNVLNVQR